MCGARFERVIAGLAGGLVACGGSDTGERPMALDTSGQYGSRTPTSWLNNWPVNARTNYALLFDRQLQPKRAWQSVIEAADETQ